MNVKVWASVSGVCVATAVVVGSIAAATHHTAAPKESPAGQMVSASVTPTPTVTVTASPAPTVTPKVSPSTVKRAAVKPRTVVVQQQEAPVANQTSTSNPPPAAPDQHRNTGTTTLDKEPYPQNAGPGGIAPPPPAITPAQPAPSPILAPSSSSAG